MKVLTTFALGAIVLLLAALTDDTTIYLPNVQVHVTPVATDTVTPTLTPTVTSTPTATPTETPIPRVALQRDNDEPESYWTGARASYQVGLLYMVEEPILLERIQADYLFGFGDSIQAQARVYEAKIVTDTLQVELIGTTPEVVHPDPGTLLLSERASIDFVFTSPISVSGDILLAIEYTAGTPSDTAGLLIDSQRPVEPNIAWYHTGETWRAHADHWLEPEEVGYPIIRGIGIRTQP